LWPEPSGGHAAPEPAHRQADDPDFEVIRRAWAAFSRNDVDRFRREVQPDVAAVPFGAAMDGSSYNGNEEVLGWWQDEILASWEWFEVIPEEFRRVGARILVTGQWNKRGKGSRVKLRVAATWVIEMRDGKIAFWQTYTEHAQALRHVGLEDA
jgi:ketosteroid isomerase-like protein